MCSMNSALGFYKAKPVQNDFTAFVDGFQKYVCILSDCEFCRQNSGLQILLSSFVIHSVGNFFSVVAATFS